MKNKRTTKGYSVTVPEALVPQIKRMAFEANRSVSSYLSWLISNDVKSRKN